MYSGHLSLLCIAWISFGLNFQSCISEDLDFDFFSLGGGGGVRGGGVTLGTSRIRPPSIAQTLY